MEIKQVIVGPLQTNCYLLVSGNELAIIDPGAESKKILKQVDKIKGKVKYIINTHCHLDHILGNSKIKKQTGAKILIHESEKDFINFTPDRFLKHKDKIKIGQSVLKVMHTPGHSAGSICLLGNGFIFTGDTIFKHGYGRFDLPGGSIQDLKNSLEKLSKLLKPGIMVYPGHDETFNL